MSVNQNSPGHRLAAWMARGAARAWPEESRKWGMALEAELFEIQGPGASLRWAIGGVMLFTRAWWNHFLRSWTRPAGVPEGGPLAEFAKNASRVPRTPRFVTALLLLASLVAVANTDIREGMRATFDAWSGEHYRWYFEPSREAQDLATVAQLRQVGEQNHDAQALAIVALLAKDDAERMKLADQAVALDSSLTWVYAYVRTSDNLTACCNGPMPAAWLDKLQKWDSDNAVPQMLVAHQSLLRFSEVWQKSGYRGPYEDEALKYLQQDKSWLAAMDSAYRAPKYDHYYSRVFDLYRIVAWRYSIRDMATTDAVLGSTIPARTGPGDARIYAEYLAERGQAAERAGNNKEAESLYRRPIEFSEAMAAQSHTGFEQEGWESIEGDSLRRLQPYLARTGRADEAALLTYKIDALQTNRSAWGPVRRWSWSENGWEGLMIRSFTGATLLFGLFSLCGLTVLFLRSRVPLQSRGRGVALASVVVDYCPLLLLLSIAGLFVAYRPVSIMYDQYMAWQSPVYDFAGLTHALYTPYETPDGVWIISANYFTTENYWIATIVGLTILAVYILFRGTLRRRPIPAV